jgi:hypothetical protein
MVRARSCWLGMLLPVALATQLAAGCSASESRSTGGESGSGAAGSGGSTGAAGGGQGGQGGEGGIYIPPSDAGPPDPQQPAEVYGQSSSTLYKLDPTTKQVTVIGPFDGCGSEVIDIAIDKDSKIIGATWDGLYAIDKTNAKCTLIASGSYPNSLSFVPQGTLDPNVEALVGYQGGTYVRIDPVSGSIKTIGNLGGGLSSSGDIVSVKGGGTYLTVTGTGCFDADCLVEVNPATGALVKNWGPVGYFSQIFGIAFWAGTVYGFCNDGLLVEITFDQGKLKTALIPTPGAPLDLSFWGAGSTTSAPPLPPPK